MKCEIDYTSKKPVFPNILKHLVSNNNIVSLLFVYSISGIGFQVDRLNKKIIEVRFATLNVLPKEQNWFLFEHLFDRAHCILRIIYGIRFATI